MKYENRMIRPTKDRRYSLIGQAQAGAWANGGDFSLRTYDSLESLFDKVAEGGYVIDKRHLPFEILLKAVSGPMDNANLPPLTISDCMEEPRTFKSMDEFFLYLATRKAGISMTYFSLDLYAEWWRRLGAKVGRMVRGNVQWKPV